MLQLFQKELQSFHVLTWTKKLPTSNLKWNAGKPQEKEWNPEEVELKSEKDQIKFEDFDKVEIRVAEVKEVEKVEGSDKLLRFRLDAGDGEDRQILSGIAKFYPNEQELVGKKLQVVANLKPRKMMKKYVSQGMILSAEHDGKLTVLTVDPSVQMEVLLANSNSVL